MNTSVERSLHVNVVIALGALVAVAISLYWIAWFLSPELVQVRNPGSPDYVVYVSFEQAFILADGWLAITALVGSIGLWKMRDWGFFLMVLAGGAAIFLALMDLAYDLEHEMFVPLTSEAEIELAIVVSLLVLGTFELALLWQVRHQFR